MSNPDASSSLPVTGLRMTPRGDSEPVPVPKRYDWADDTTVRRLSNQPIIDDCARCGGHLFCANVNHSEAELSCLQCGDLTWESTVATYARYRRRAIAILRRSA